MIITHQFIFLFFIAIALTILAMVVELPLGKKILGEQPAHYLRVVFVLLLLMAIVAMGMNNFQATLTLLVAGTGIIALIDRLFFHKRRVAQQRARPFIVDNAYSFFGVLLLVWVIRCFLIQPYRVPTGSLLPTVEPGDFLVVNQFAYGLRFPVTNKKFMEVGEPKRGEIVLFYYPVDPNMIFVKRLIGLPGDHIESRNRVLYINGKEMPQKTLGTAIDSEPAMANYPEAHIPVQEKEEDLDGVKHRIYLQDTPTALSADFSIDIPAGQYFMVGDNRDNSGDSRAWGFVPEGNLIGKAFGIWMSWDAIEGTPRWNRIGMSVK